jgi:hypothetical protein
MRAMMAVLVLAGCAAAPAMQAPVPVQDRAGRIAAECRVLEAAQAAMVAQGLAALPDVVAGCPAHPGARDTLPLAAQSAALRVANAAALPPAVLAAGLEGARAFRRMISRGVPEAVAVSVAQGPVWAAAMDG